MEGTVYIPYPTRIQMVPTDPVFSGPDLLTDLLMTNSDQTKLDSTELGRMEAILTRLGGERLMSQLEAPTNEWTRGASWKELQAVMLGGALIRNEDILAISHPTAISDPSYRREVFAILNEFVSNRGVNFPPALSKEKRHAKTLIVETDDPELIAKADVVLLVEQQYVRQMKKDDPQILGKFRGFLKSPGRQSRSFHQP